MKCCWSPRRARLPPSTANSFTFAFPVAASASTSSPMTPNCSPAASPIRTNARPLSNCKPSAMAWPSSVSSATERLEEKTAAASGGRFRTPCARRRRRCGQTRLSPVQRLAQVVEDVRRWLGERLSLEQKETVAEKTANRVGQAGRKDCARRQGNARSKAAPGDAHTASSNIQQRRSGGMHI